MRAGKRGHYQTERMEGVGRGRQGSGIHDEGHEEGRMAERWTMKRKGYYCPHPVSVPL